jgi:hypothetical protein
MKRLTLFLLAVIISYNAQSKTNNWSSTVITSDVGITASSIQTNGICTYSYNVLGEAVGPVSIKANNCTINLISYIVNDETHYTIKVNRKIVARN